MEVQMWKSHRNVEKWLNGGKTAGKREIPAIPA
jgi:hypothetical protein